MYTVRLRLSANRAVIALCALHVAGCTGTSAAAPSTPVVSGASPSPSVSPPAPSALPPSSKPPAPTALPSSDAATALAQLGSLAVVAVRPAVPGYQRGCGTGQACRFGPAWTDDTDAPGGHNGCDTRNDMLRAHLTGVTYRAGSGCVVIAGTYADPYTGKTIAFAKANATAIQVDHVVPLALAWDLGAAQWPQAERNTYANDEATVLTLADGPTNEKKGDSGPAKWMPPNKAYACAYDTQFIAILAKYSLPVTAPDSAAMKTALATC